jgi:hypothetical protein
MVYCRLLAVGIHTKQSAALVIEMVNSGKERQKPSKSIDYLLDFRSIRFIGECEHRRQIFEKKWTL